MRNPSLRFYLRERTAAAHAKLDNLVGIDSRENYGRYLRGQFAFRATIEKALGGATFPDWFNGWRPREIADALRMDMADLAIPPNTTTNQMGHDLVSVINQPSSFLGALYVMEGSALGATLIYRQAKELGLSETFGARHLALQTHDKESWRNFLNILEHDDTIDAEAAVQAADATFELAQICFAKEIDGH